MNIEHLYKAFLECSSVTTDTRKVTTNAIFFALKGDNFNGNTFAQQALESGAKYAVIDEKEYATNPQMILVKDVLTALQELATYHRKKLNLPIIALTGSNGKTTTKELINAVLSTQFRTSATKGNLNNHIGVPLTLLEMTQETEIGIVEMGANHHKEIAFLCSIAQPDYGLITNFGKAHLEGFGSLEGVITAKSELYDYLKVHNKTVFINANDATQLKQIGAYKPVFTFGEATNADANIKLTNAQSEVIVNFDGTEITSHLTGIYNYNNISSAIAIASYFKVATVNIKKGIETYIPSNNRSQFLEKGSNKIILDAYNANPTSMKAALENFIQYNSDLHKTVFLGDMFELGNTSAEEHQAILNYLETHFNGSIYIIGKHFHNTTSNGENTFKFELFEDLKKHLEGIVIENEFILIKGSRGMALERVLELL
ncbi:UDP-N-acetylmuramoyl-tripeptide--D-alanyl-D-alanine ligase [Mangrovimonas sp. YM274]|uniref:UDP-N-acetylmuramoyl-tripeptide--D-alanyl-D- alanine ligase n=1 Tax=Mangrovimonas sp. YM274 TaxID=3070660 RepID=UPI0027DBC05D|nr:UDP-N-acetylmuramoyl-tripeptide--D-alanyl-D-alanine ligase [Mangrovimonas sp. YM274]WMI69650.1 UDP-N-acetylmuramoyl-tripeptide--D-alanyl-D-alanine ligase [Mangrovimonas sp. YM274]